MRRGGKAYNQHTSYKQAIKERDNYTCQMCGCRVGSPCALHRFTPVYLDVDHIVPHAISGESKPEGMRVLCHKCNVATRRPRRDARPSYDEWIAQLVASR